MKYLRMNKKQHNKLMADVMKQANKLRTMDLNALPEEITIKVKPKNKQKISMWFAPAAWIKMNTLVKHYNTEVAWHGITEYNREKHVLYVREILVYPQMVTGAHVESDDENYGIWLSQLSDSQFDNNRMQGHSHVGFGAQPSPTDINFYYTFMEQHNPDYYMFMITNKQGAMWFHFYDVEEGLLYETEDIVVDIRFKESTATSWLKEIEPMTQKYTYKKPEEPKNKVIPINEKQVMLDNIKAISDGVNEALNKPADNKCIVRDAYGNDITRRYYNEMGGGD